MTDLHSSAGRRQRRRRRRPPVVELAPAPHPDPAVWQGPLLAALSGRLGVELVWAEPPAPLGHQHGPWAFAAAVRGGQDEPLPAPWRGPLVVRLGDGRADLEREAAALDLSREARLAAPLVLALVPLGVAGDGPPDLHALVLSAPTGVPLPELVGFNLHHSDELLAGFAVHQAALHDRLRPGVPPRVPAVPLAVAPGVGVGIGAAPDGADGPAAGEDPAPGDGSAPAEGGPPDAGADPEGGEADPAAAAAADGRPASPGDGPAASEVPTAPDADAGAPSSEEGPAGGHGDPHHDGDADEAGPAGAIPRLDVDAELDRYDETRHGERLAWLRDHRPPPGPPVLCHGGYQPMCVYGPEPDHWDAHGGVGEGLTAVNWCGAVWAERELDVAFTLVAFWSAPFFAPNRSERTAIKMIRNTLSNGYHLAYTAAVGAVDADRVRFWQAFHTLRGLARFEGGRDEEGSVFAVPDRGPLPEDLHPQLERLWTMTTRR